MSNQFKTSEMFLFIYHGLKTLQHMTFHVSLETQIDIV